MEVESLNTQDAEQLYEVLTPRPPISNFLFSLSLSSSSPLLFSNFPFLPQNQAESQIQVDYSSLSDKLKRTKEKKAEEELLEQMKQITVEIERAAPNMRAIDK